ncbi:methionyl-tRNA formyltransferase [Streptomyces sp. INA 01156]
MASPVAERARGRDRGAQAREAPGPGVPGAAARDRPDCCPVVAYGALLPGPPSTSRNGAGSTCTSRCCPPGAVRRPCSTPSWRGRDHRCVHLPHRGGARLRAGLRHGHRGDPPHRHQRRPAHPARLRRRRAARRDHGRHRGRHPEGRTAARRRGHPRPKVSVEDARVDWNAPALRVGRIVRGCTRRPVPGPPSGASGSSSSRWSRRPHGPRPGRVSAGKNNVYVGTGSHAVELLWVQAQGKKPMRAADWARGARIGAEETVGT